MSLGIQTGRVLRSLRDAETSFFGLRPCKCASFTLLPVATLRHLFAALGLVIGAAAWAQPTTTPGEPPTDPVTPPPTEPPGGDPPPPPPGEPPTNVLRLVNVSARGSVAGPLDNENNTFGGFIVRDGTARVLVHGAGPRLRPNPGGGLVNFDVPDYITTPRIDVWQGNVGTVTPVARNERWGVQTFSNVSPLPSVAQLNALRISLGAYDLETGSADSATIVDVAPGAYTMQLSSATTATGTGVLGFWLDTTSTGVGSFSNVSARGRVTPGAAGNLTAGAVIDGPTTHRARVVAIGLGPFLKAGLPSALSNLTLTVRDATGTAVASNTNWTTASNPSAINAALSTVGSGIVLDPAKADSAVLVDLPPGGFTFEVSSSQTGIALVGLWIVSESPVAP